MKPWCLLLAATLAIACGDSGPHATTNPAVGPYTGTLVTPDGAIAVVELEITDVAARVANPTVAPVTGPLAVTGHATFTTATYGQVDLTGTYDPATHALSGTIAGTGLVLTATFDGTSISGSLNGAGFADLLPGPAELIQAYCGEFHSTDQTTAGTWTLLTSSAAQLAGGAFAATTPTGPRGGVLAGTLMGTALTLAFVPAGGSATGTADGTTASGTWTGAGTGGMFLGTAAACPTPPTGAVTVVTVAATPTTIGSGQTAQLTATVDGTGTFSHAVSWSIVDGGGTLTGVGATVSYTAPTVAAATVAHVRATSAAAAAISGTVAIMITPTSSPSVVAHRTIAAGNNFYLALKPDGTVVAWGDDTFGQLGDGPPNAASTTPVAVSGLTGVVAIAAGQFHALALKGDGTVWGWGLNQAGELGGVATTNTPKQLTSLGGQTIVAIAAGDSFSLAVTAAGLTYAFGANDAGQCGPGAAMVGLPQLNGLATTLQVAAGRSHLLAIKQIDASTTRVVTMGNNDFGELGNNSLSASSNPITLPGTAALDIAAGFDHSAAVIDGKLYAWGNVQGLGMNAVAAQRVPLEITGGNFARHVAAGYETTFFVKTDGTAWSFGSDQQNALGINRPNVFVATPTQLPGLANVTAIAAASLHAIALTAAGDVYTWGAGATATPTLVLSGIAQPQ
jgi:alpha-tubulin suppressor-like RCC1 family protein